MSGVKDQGAAPDVAATRWLLTAMGLPAASSTGDSSV
jgi:hypothetical protein